MQLHVNTSGSSGVASNLHNPSASIMLVDGSVCLSTTPTLEFLNYTKIPSLSPGEKQTFNLSITNNNPQKCMQLVSWFYCLISQIGSAEIFSLSLESPSDWSVTLMGSRDGSIMVQSQMTYITTIEVIAGSQTQG